MQPRNSRRRSGGFIDLALCSAIVSLIGVTLSFAVWYQGRLQKQESQRIEQAGNKRMRQLETDVQLLKDQVLKEQIAPAPARTAEPSPLDLSPTKIREKASRDIDKNGSAAAIGEARGIDRQPTPASEIIEQRKGEATGKLEGRDEHGK